jgi:hypothetical protein
MRVRTSKGPTLSPVAFLKLFENAPLTAGLLAPFRGDRVLAEEKRCALDRLYVRVCDDLDALFRAVGLATKELAALRRVTRLTGANPIGAR